MFELKNCLKSEGSRTKGLLCGVELDLKRKRVLIPDVLFLGLVSLRASFIECEVDGLLGRKRH